MYLYFNKERKMQTAIAHGSPIRQGDSFGLYVCFDLDFFDAEDNVEFANSEYLYCYYKTSNGNWSSNPLPLEQNGVITFYKNAANEVTYKFVDDEKYISYYYPVDAAIGVTTNSGQLDLVFSFFNPIQNIPISNAANFSAQLYVEPTYGRNRPKTDTTMSETNYNYLLSLINNISVSKNIALKSITNVTYDANDTIEQKLLKRANSIYDSWNQTKKGWIIIGQKENIRDMYMLFGDGNMFVLSSETSVLYRYDDNVLEPLTYGINVFGTDLGTYLSSKGKNLKQFIDDCLTRIIALETGAIMDLKYENDEIDYKQNGTYHKLVDNDTLREDLGVKAIEESALTDLTYENDEIGYEQNGTYHKLVDNDTLREYLGVENIEEKGTFGVEYTNYELKVKNGLNNEKQTLLVTYPATGTIANEPQLLATAKAVFDTLEKGAIGSNDQNSNTSNYNEMMRRIRYMYQYFSESQDDVDNKINKLEEIIEVLNNMPENYNIFEIVNDIYNRLGEDGEGTYFYNPIWSSIDKARFSIKGRIEELEHNADSHIMTFMRYADNQNLFTIPTTSWLELATPNLDYPNAQYYAEIQSDFFKDVLDMEIIFDKLAEQSIIISSTLETTTGVLTLYTELLPDFVVTIDTIKIISNLYHTNSISADALLQIHNNTLDIISHTQTINNLIQKDEVLEKKTNQKENKDVATKTQLKPAFIPTVYSPFQISIDNAKNIWTDGIDIYYSSGSNQYVLDRYNSTWIAKTWNGLASFDGKGIWTDGVDIYYRNNKVLNKSNSTWGDISWNASSLIWDEYGHIWTDGSNIYYDSPSASYKIIFDQTNRPNHWADNSWNITMFGEDVWTDGNNIYYSRVSDQYVLNKTTKIWEEKTWSGLTRFNGELVWSDGKNIYCSNGDDQYILDVATSTWTQYNTGISFGNQVWTDGENIYYTDNGSTGKRTYILRSTIPQKTLETRIVQAEKNIKEKCIKKSETSGFVKNDGTIDTNSYLLASNYKKTFIISTEPTLVGGNLYSIPKSAITGDYKQSDYVLYVDLTTGQNVKSFYYINIIEENVVLLTLIGDFASGGGLPTITIAQSQMISQNELQLTQDQYNIISTNGVVNVNLMGMQLMGMVSNNASNSTNIELMCSMYDNGISGQNNASIIVYAISVVKSTMIATFYQNSFGKAKQLYQHNICLAYASGSTHYYGTLEIINDNNTPITTASQLSNYLSENGFNSYEKQKSCYITYDASNNHHYIFMGLYYNSNDSSIYGMAHIDNLTATNLTIQLGFTGTMGDTIIEL